MSQLDPLLDRPPCVILAVVLDAKASSTLLASQMLPGGDTDTKNATRFAHVS